MNRPPAAPLKPVEKASPCLVVGIGASSGGQEALERIFTLMPIDCGIAFLVALHLPPAGPSFLAEMLGRYTTMQVVTAREGEALAPNTVYVLPAGHDLTVEKATIRLKLPGAALAAAPHHPIDRLFDSLAAGQDRLPAVAVILSGTGRDGAEGVQRVKEAGGTVLVQEPASAMNAGKPLNAIATGAVDVVLPVDDIPYKIAQLAGGSCPLAPGECHPASLDEELAAILAAVKGATGHDFSSYKRNTVLRRIERRMAVNEAGGIGKYGALLQENPQEAHALAKDILIGVTSFFRDPAAFEICRQQVIPKLFENRPPDAPVRIWHACCATGEEVYSMAMLILEYLGEHNLQLPVQFFATDIDEVAIAQARSGLYPEEAIAQLGAARLATFFTRSGERWQVNKQLREMIVFAHHSLIKDPPFSRLDLLVCRNFLIYLNADMQKRLIALFHQVLKPGGFLFLGSAEAVGPHNELFAPLDKKWKIFARRAVEAAPQEALFPYATPLRLPPAAARGKAPAAEEPTPAFLAEKLMLERYSPPFVVVDDRFEVVHFSNRTSRFLEIPRGEPTREVLKMTRPELRPALRAALYKSFAEKKRVEFPGGRVREAAGEVSVNVLVEPIGAPPLGKLALVVFEPLTEEILPALAPAGGTPGDDRAKEALIRQLEEQLRITHEQLQAANEQLDTSHQGFLSSNEELTSINEEFQSANEELQSTNEELETSKEELQALNEELVTVNSELQGTVEELNSTNTDMENLLASTEIATIFLDRGLNIKRFTPAAASLFNLMPSDQGRPFRHLAAAIDWPTLAGDVETILAGEPLIEREVTTLRQGRWYLKRVHPYRASRGRVDGIVITFVDITLRKEAEAATAHLASFPQLNPNPVLEVDLEGRITFANPASRQRLAALGLAREELARFLPADLKEILAAWDRSETVTLEREVAVGERLFAVSIFLTPQFGSARVFAYDNTERIRAEKRLSRQVALVEGINAIFEGVHGTASEEELAETCLAVVKLVTWSGYAALAEVGEDGRLRQLAVSDPQLQMALSRETEKERRGGARSRSTLLERVLTEGCALWNNDAGCEPAVLSAAGQPPFTSLLLVPLSEGGKTTGVVAVAQRQEGYGSPELESLDALTPVIVEAFRRFRAERSLKASMERLRLALEAAKAGIWEWDLATRSSSWSGELWRSFALDRQPCAPTLEALVAALHPDDRQGTIESVRRAAVLRQELHLEFRVRDLSGAERHLLAFGRPVPDGDEDAGRFIGIVLDVTERTRAQAALRSNEAELATILENIDEGLVVSTLSGELTHWNRAALLMHGFSDPAQAQRSLPESTRIFELSTLEGEPLPLAQWPISRVLAGEHVRDLEIRVRRLDRDWQGIFNYHGALVHDRNGQPLMAVVTMSDVTARKAAEDELRRAKRAAEAANSTKSQFLANMSHELRTPMTGVLGMLEIALEGELAPQQRECIETADRSARSLLRILNDILDLTRVESGKLSLEEHPFSLNDLLASVMDIFVPEARRKGIGLRLLMADGVPGRLLGDQVRLRQVLTNLCGNAVKFTAEGSVELRVLPVGGFRKGRGKLRFEVQDTGIGIAPDKRHLLFSSFSQVDASDTRRFGGTGLGLAISKQIVEQMGGEISCASRPGEGSTFTIELPFCAACDEGAAPAATAAADPPPCALAGGEPPRILVAEDDPTVSKILCMVLGRLDYRLDLVADGQSALDRWQEGEYDLVLMDVQMPILDGFAATRAIRAREEGSGRHTLIVAMTAHASPQDEERCLSAGMDAYLSKPIDLKASIALIDRLVARRRGERPA